MLAEDGPNNEEDPNRWVWSDCKLVLRRINVNNPSEESYENLQAEVELESEDIQQPFMPEILFQKQMQFNPKKGFYCKKGTSLSSLKVKLQKNYLDLLDQDEDIIMVYCDLTIVYPRRKDTHFYLQQICTQGEKRKIFNQSGQVLFDNIVLKQSSLKKFNSKFSFLVSICASSPQQSRIILKTLISTAFYCEPCKIIRRERFVRQISTMKLLSPVKFLKPISCIHPTTLKQHSVQKVVHVIKQMNRNSHRLTKIHPFYLIYHLIDIIEVYYHSQQVDGLNQMFEKFCPFLEDKEDTDKGKNNVIKYELKKTKRIRKIHRNSNGIQKVRHQKNIHIQFNNHCAPQSHLMLITFHDSILQCISNEIQRQKALNQQSLFQKEIQKQVIQLTKMFQKWRIFQIKVDLLKKDYIETFWRDIQKDYVFETYKRHYHILQGRLLKNSNNCIETEKLTDDVS